MGIIETIRKWIDGASGEEALEKMGDTARQRHQAEEFIVKVSKEIDTVMQNEKFSTPDESTDVVNIPPTFVVYLGAELDKQWKPTPKRDALVKGLNTVTQRRARELNAKEIESKVVEVR